jgi:hypothetical protein
MKLPGSIRDAIDALELEDDEKAKLVDYINGLDDLPEDPTEREARSFVRSAKKDLADKDSKIIRQKAPKKKDKSEDEEPESEDDEPKDEPKPKKEKVKIEEGLKLSFKAFLAEVDAQ